MANCKTTVTPLLTHWGYCTNALSNRYDLQGKSRFKQIQLHFIFSEYIDWFGTSPTSALVEELFRPMAYYSGVPNNQTCLTINAVKKNPRYFIIGCNRYSVKQVFYY